MTPNEIALLAFFGMLYFASVYVVCLSYILSNTDDWVGAVWWPIHLAKALLKSLYRALFTGWKL